MKLNELMEKYGQWEIDEEELFKILHQPSPSSAWDLRDGDEYCYLNSMGVLSYDVWRNKKEDYERRNQGNVFLTEKQAFERYEQLRIESLLLQYGGSRQFIEDGYAICMEKDSEDTNTWKVEPYYVSKWYQQGAIYFETEEQCQNAINEIGEKEIKRYLFNID